MTNRILSTLVAASVSATALAACGDDDKSASSRPAGSTTQAAAPTEGRAPYGTYVRQMTKADLRRTQALRDEHGPNQETPPVGQYRLTVAQGSGQDVLKATDPSDFTVAMDVTPAGDVLRLTSYVDPTQASFCGPDVPASGRYAFALDGSSLKLKPVKSDPCADRDAILTGTWKKG